MIHRFLPAVLLGAFLAGCASSPLAMRGDEYLITTQNCRCERYSVKDPAMPVHFDFTASYDIDEDFVTRIGHIVRNEGKDSVSFSNAYVQVASRNVPYQYNRRFVPLTSETVSPRDERTITLVGRAAPKTSDPWLAVAGEELVVTIKGISYGGRTLAQQAVTFVPRNPKLAD